MAKKKPGRKPAPSFGKPPEVSPGRLQMQKRLRDYVETASTDELADFIHKFMAIAPTTEAAYRTLTLLLIDSPPPDTP